VRKFFEQVGPVLEMPESRFDAFNAAYSPGHGYHALATLAKAAQDAGLDGETALTAGAHALAKAIFYWRESGQKLSNLLQEAATERQRRRWQPWTRRATRELSGEVSPPASGNHGPTPAVNLQS
jgi:hypothetical protein